jgi:hypothetical protein
MPDWGTQPSKARIGAGATCRYRKPKVGNGGRCPTLPPTILARCCIAKIKRQQGRYINTRFNPLGCAGVTRRASKMKTYVVRVDVRINVASCLFGFAAILTVLLR